jgi:hypothetical protein
LVDLGAYEIPSPASILPYCWLQQYGLALDGSADFADTGEGMNNWQEWKAGTDPANALSVLKVLAPSPGTAGITVRWQAVSGIT